ncbi:MAG: thioredoxin family protein [Aquificaceae bacterium]
MESLFKLVVLFLALFFAFMAMLRIYAGLRSKKMQGRRVDFIKDGVIYFYSERCGACKIMKPEVEKLKESVEVLELDVSKPEGFQKAKDLGIVATPTTLVVKDGIIKRVFVGVVRHQRILQEV